METATRVESENPGTARLGIGVGQTAAGRLLTVTAAYVLSEAGRKALLLAGGDGRAAQQLTFEVAANRLHLVSVDEQGTARLRLQPRFERNARQEVIRIDAPPVYDAPPTSDDLLRAAAQNHELERAYEAERLAARTRRRDTERELCLQVAQAFLADRTRRALTHPAPSPKRCYVATEDGRRLAFDGEADEGPARDVPPEAHRRFRADLAQRAERNRQQRAVDVANHEEKKRFIADWIAAHGTLEQQARQVAGVLPMEEAIEAITEQAFAALREHPPYARDGLARFQVHVRQWPPHEHAVVSAADLVITSTVGTKATASQWALMQALQRAAPDASVLLRMHKITWKADPKIPALQLFSVVAVRRVGPLTLRREYEAPDH
jgi:hypothetical protein